VPLFAFCQRVRNQLARARGCARRRIQHLLAATALVGSSVRKSFQVDNFDLKKDAQLYR
jgi:hypothetical protein